MTLISLIAAWITLATLAAIIILIIGRLTILAPDTLSTNKRAIWAILQLLKQRKGKTFYDLGCGDGQVLIAVSKAYPEMKVIGLEKLFWQYIYARFRIWASGTSAKVFRKDFFNVELKEATAVYCYLPEEVMSKLKFKFKKELRPGTLVIANTNGLPGWGHSGVISTHNERSRYGKIFYYLC